MMSHRIVPAGDSALVLEFPGQTIDLDVCDRTAAIARAMSGAALNGVRDIVPTYRSVAVYFDPLLADPPAIAAALERVAGEPPNERRVPGDVIQIPVCYGGEFGPDLPQVAAFAGVSEAEAIDLHCSRTYRVLMLGFLPGFAYMGLVDPRIAVPRLATPRPRVPRGSVAVALEQTGIYPSESAGGWQLIGRTPARPFDMGRARPFLFSAGDEVTFVPIAPEEFDERDRAR